MIQIGHLRKARAVGLRDLGLAQLGSKGVVAIRSLRSFGRTYHSSLATDYDPGPISYQ
jgi:hypothetical protein